MNSIKKVFRLVVINIVIFSVAIFIVAELAALAINVYTKPTDDVDLPNYKNIPWAKTYHREYKESHEFEYKDFVIWRRKPYSGETVNVGSDGRRLSYQPENPETDTVYAFFGGSTMWGNGGRDEDTIPSIFAKMNRVNVQNNGEGAYVARQSLARLTNNYILEKEARKKVVIFYDGVNDVVQRCWRESTGINTYHVKDYQEKIAGTYTFWIFDFRPVISYFDELLQDFAKLSEQETSFNCAKSPERAREVARLLIETWQQARLLAEARGDAFVAILQPVPYLGSPNISHLPHIERDDLKHKPEYQAVYAEVRKLMKSYPGMNFIDLTDAYDGDEIYYYDFSHVSPNGHVVLVDRMSAAIRDFGLL